MRNPPLEPIRYSQEDGIGVERLNDNPSSEARIIAERADCTRPSCEAGHSPSASSTAAVSKRPVVKEEIRIRKDVVEEVEEDVRREEIDVEDETTRNRGI